MLTPRRHPILLSDEDYQYSFPRIIYQIKQNQTFSVISKKIRFLKLKFVINIKNGLLFWIPFNVIIFFRCKFSCTFEPLRQFHSTIAFDFVIGVCTVATVIETSQIFFHNLIFILWICEATYRFVLFRFTSRSYLHHSFSGFGIILIWRWWSHLWINPKCRSSKLFRSKNRWISNW